jgi:hypothetical protein
MGLELATLYIYFLNALFSIKQDTSHILKKITDKTIMIITVTKI